MDNQLDKASYAIGMNIAENLKQQGIDEINPEMMAQALADSMSGMPKMGAEEAGQTLQQYFEEKQKAKFSANLEKGEKFLAGNKLKPEVNTTESGLQYEVLNEGSGSKPGPTSQVSVHYHGTLIDGTVFDSSVERGQPATFGVNQVIKGWTEALQLMPEGSKYRLYIPQDLAYGANPHPGGAIQPYDALVFDVELLSVN